MDHRSLQKYREQQIKLLPPNIGVYALAEVANTVRYVGQSQAGIRPRVQRHTTSARSDVIANRLINAGDIAYVYAYVVHEREKVTPLETHLIHLFNDKFPVMNGKIPARLTSPLSFVVPEPIVIQIMPDEVIEERKDPAVCLLRHMKAHSNLLDYIVDVKDNSDLLRSLGVSLQILNKYTDDFLKS